MKTILELLLIVLIVAVVIVGVRSGRSPAPRRQFPGPGLDPRKDMADDSFPQVPVLMGAETSHHHAGHHGTDCAPSHDAGGSCSSDGGGGGGH